MSIFLFRNQIRLKSFQFYYSIHTSIFHIPCAAFILCHTKMYVIDNKNSPQQSQKNEYISLYILIIIACAPVCRHESFLWGLKYVETAMRVRVKKGKGTCFAWNRLKKKMRSVGKEGIFHWTSNNSRQASWRQEKDVIAKLPHVPDSHC